MKSGTSKRNHPTVRRPLWLHVFSNLAQAGL